MYRIFLGDAQAHAVPCSFRPSVVTGKVISVNENGSALVVLPDGTERTNGEPAESPNFDSPWTRADVFGELAVYRSEAGGVPGVPRAYRVVR